MNPIRTMHRIRLRRPYTVAWLTHPVAETGSEHEAEYFGRGYPDRVFFEVGALRFSAVIGPDAELVRSAPIAL